jgi:hypothetical protein
VTEEETIRSLLQLGWSRRRVARETGHHRATIERVARAMALAAGNEKPQPASDRQVAIDLPGIGVESVIDPKVATDPLEALLGQQCALPLLGMRHDYRDLT